MMTLTDVEFDRFLKLPQNVIDSFGTMSNAEFQQWRASVNEASAPPAQNLGGLLLEETSALPAPVTNTDDSRETTPTTAPSPVRDEETTSGNLGDDSTPGSNSPTVSGL